jgi:hypothetical protein
MIALCPEHAHKADNGSFTDDQLRELKREGRSRAALVRGRFDWMRQDLLAVVGKNFFYQESILFQINDTPCIWFDRDEDGYLLLNFKMPTISGQPRAQIERNFWNVLPAVDEIVCPPNGRLIEVAYADGDKFRAEFFNADSPGFLGKKYPPLAPRDWYDMIQFPVTVVELWETAAGTPIEFGPKSFRMGNSSWTDCFSAGNGKGAMRVNVSPNVFSMLFPS